MIVVRCRKRAAPGYREVGAMIFELQADFCQSLANPKRLKIVNLLKGGELPVKEIEKSMAIAKANLSQHLTIMRQKGILTSRREGTTTYYRLASPKIADTCSAMQEVLMSLLAERERFSKKARQALKRY